MKLSAAINRISGAQQCAKCNLFYGGAGRHARHSGQDR